MAGFGGLGILTQPMAPQDLLDPDLPQLEENLQQVIPPEPVPEKSWYDRNPYIQNQGTQDTGVSSWHPQGIPESGTEGDLSAGSQSAYPSLRGKVIQSPNDETGQPQVDVPPRPSPEPIALRQYQLPNGTTFTTDERTAARAMPFFQELKEKWGYEPKVVQGYNERNIAGTNTPSHHGERNRLGYSAALDIDPDTHVRGQNVSWGNIPIADIARRHGFDSGIGWTNPDAMHIQVSGGASNRSPQQSRGTGKMDEDVQSIGSLVDPQAQAGTASPKVKQADRYNDPDPSAAPYSSWGEMARAPQRNALISFGLHAMTGGYGLGSALGAGLEAGGATAAALQGQLENERKTEEAATEKERDRSSREKIAETNSDSRERVAEARIAAMLERTRMNLDAKVGNASLALRYRTEARKIVEGNINNLQLSQSEREVMVDQLAGQMYDSDVARGRVPAGVGGGNSAGREDFGGMGGGDTAAGKPPAKAAENKDSGRSLRQLMGDAKHGPKVREMLQTPEGQQELLKLNPRLKSEIDFYNQGNRMFGYGR